jgi:hypothetical protein
MAVTPWKAYHGSALALNASALLRNTPAIKENIQPAEISHTTAAAAHHTIVISPSSYIE